MALSPLHDFPPPSLCLSLLDLAAQSQRLLSTYSPLSACKEAAPGSEETRELEKSSTRSGSVTRFPLF